MRGLLLAAAAGLLLGCASGSPLAGASWSLPDDGFAPEREYLLVGGAGRAAGPVSSETQRRSLSRDAALADAWERASAYLEALPLKRGGTVRDRLDVSPELRGRFLTLVRSAEVVSTSWRPGGAASVVIRLPKDRIHQVLGVAP